MFFKRKAELADQSAKDEAVDERVELGRKLEEELVRGAIAVQRELEKLRIGVRDA